MYGNEVERDIDGGLFHLITHSVVLEIFGRRESGLIGFVRLRKLAVHTGSMFELQASNFKSQESKNMELQDVKRTTQRDRSKSSE